MTSGIIAFAFVLGMVALLNPCGIPLLPVYLAAFVDNGDDDGVARVRAGVRAGFALTLGFLAVFSMAGIVAGSLHVLLTVIVPPLMMAIAAAITIIGTSSVAGHPVSFHVPSRFRTGRSMPAMVGFGIAYAIGSLSCSLPVFVAAVAGALASGSPIVTAAVVVAYGVGMGVLATALAVAVSLAGTLRLRRLRRWAAVLPRAAGAICIAMGLYLMAYWWAQAGGPPLVAPVTRALDLAQRSLVTLVEDAWIPIGATLLAVVVLAMMLAAHRMRHPAMPGLHSRDSGPWREENS